jgi:hypothetical protein
MLNNEGGWPLQTHYFSGIGMTLLQIKGRSSETNSHYSFRHKARFHIYVTVNDIVAYEILLFDTSLYFLHNLISS